MGFSEKQRKLLLSGKVLICPMYYEGDRFYKFIRVSAYEYREFGGGAVFAVNPDKLISEEKALFSVRIFEVEAKYVFSETEVSGELINYLVDEKDINLISDAEKILNENVFCLNYDEFKEEWELECYCPI